MKKVLMILIFAIIFCGCQQKKGFNSQENAQTKLYSSSSDVRVAVLDSMLMYLNVDAEPTSTSSYEWKWVRLTRTALSYDENPIDLDSLDALSFNVDKSYAPLTASSPSEADKAAGVFAATACFRLLNAYHSLSDQLSENLAEDWLLLDYTLWKEVYSEFEEQHIYAYGRNTSYMLCMVQKTFCELRHTILKEEIGYFDVERKGTAKWFVGADEICWKPEQKAIRLWYNHRMRMADKLGNNNLF